MKFLALAAVAAVFGALNVQAVHPVAGCRQFHTITNSDSCTSVAKKFHISTSTFYALNPGLHHAGDHICDNLDTGKKYCVKAPKGKRAIARRTTTAVNPTAVDLSSVKTKLQTVLSKIQVLDLSGTEGDAVSKVEVKVQSVLTLVTSKTAPVLSTVQSKVQSVLSLVQNLDIPALQAVETQLQGVVALVENLVSSVGNLVQLQTVLAGVQTKLTSITSVLDNAGVPVGSIQTKVTSLLAELNGSSPDLSGVQTEVKTLLTELKGYAVPALQPVTSQLSGALTLVQGIIPLNLNL
ncbi:hypothetical protein INT44_001499 [Umbelopsis vinacea]|uniref:LysM domain-containing protein n=1 Tax=Umbelopsis vinacea TaxID=44442 RepID=A0A8H7PQ24_9FUNG|nr:hypothetical protein INT44_001499 [Umbelopsis vinacea]